MIPRRNGDRRTNDRNTERKRDIPTDREAARQRERETDKEKQ